MSEDKRIVVLDLLRQYTVMVGAGAAPWFPISFPASAVGRSSRPAPATRWYWSCIGLGGQGAREAIWAHSAGSQIPEWSLCVMSTKAT